MVSRLVCITLFVLSLFVACNNANEYKAYCSTILNMRAEKNSSLITEGILPEDAYNGFKGLQYFDIDSTYRVWAKLTPLNGQMIEMRTNSEEKSIYYAVFNLSFKIKDSSCVLTAYSKTLLHPKMLFVPFKDLSNQHTSYGAGRYLDIPYNNDAIICLDFNLAYNPYCHYNSAYICPIVPINNHLNQYIYAGEKRLHP